MKVLTTDTSGWGDLATRIGGSFWQKFKEWLDSQGIESVFLEHADAQRGKWDAALTNEPIGFISHNGHGNYTTVTGYNQDILAQVGKYDPSLYQGLGLSFLSCECEKELIKDMVSKGCPFGNGYSEVYIFYYGHTEPPCEDRFAKAFIDTHLLGDKLMLQGKTGAEAFEAVNQEYTNQAHIWQDENPDVAATLLYDRDIHAYDGDGNWKPKEGPMNEILIAKVYMTKKAPPPPPPKYDIKFEVKEKAEGLVIARVVGISSERRGKFSSLGISPSFVEFDLPADGSTNVNFSAWFFTGDVEITLLELGGITVEPTIVPVVAQENGYPFTLTFHGDPLRGIEDLIGYVRFYGIDGHVAIKIKATIHHKAAAAILIEGAAISLNGLSGITDANGEAWFRDMDAGAYHWEVTHPDYNPEEGDVIS